MLLEGVTLGSPADESIPGSVGMTGAEMHQLYRLLALAKYEDRYVIPTAHEERAHELEETACSLDYEGGPGMYASRAFGEASGRPAPVAVETFHALRNRQTADQPVDPERRGARVNLLNWDGKGQPEGLLPPRREEERG